MRIKMWFSGNPIPKARPRFGFGRVYTEESTSEWEETVGWQCKDQFKHRPLLGPLSIDFIFYRDNLRRVDLENLEKAMLDGLQGILYEDDSQVKEKHGKVLYSKEHPGVEVEIWQL